MIYLATFNSSRCQNLSKAEQEGELQVFIPTNFQKRESIQTFIISRVL